MNLEAKLQWYADDLRSEIQGIENLLVVGVGRNEKIFAEAKIKHFSECLDKFEKLFSDVLHKEED